MTPVRLQKALASAGLCSRRQAEAWILEGRVRVNGTVAELGQKVDPDRDSIRVAGRLLRPVRRARRYVLLNKPRGVLSAVSDPAGRPTVIDLLPPALRRGVKPVGRLDFASEGLLLLTDDGDFAQAVSHPSRGCSKTYRVKVSGEPTEATLDRLRRGVPLDGRRTAPCEIQRHHSTSRTGEGNTWLSVVLHEGRSRQIRRMFELVGNRVSKLKRVAIGPIRDDRLKAGAFRALRPEEIGRLLEGRNREGANRRN
jgi:pseudouridine synthase